MRILKTFFGLKLWCHALVSGTIFLNLVSNEKFVFETDFQLSVLVKSIGSENAWMNTDFIPSLLELTRGHGLNSYSCMNLYMHGMLI